VPSSDGSDNCVLVLGPAEGARVVVGLSDGSVDRSVERHERMKHASLEALLGQLGEEALDGVQPRGRSRREVEGNARMTAEPLDHLGMLVGGVVVQDHMDQFARGDLALNGIEETDELLVPVTLHATSDHAARRYVPANSVVVLFRL